MKKCLNIAPTRCFIITIFFIKKPALLSESTLLQWKKIATRKFGKFGGFSKTWWLLNLIKFLICQITSPREKNISATNRIKLPEISFTRYSQVYCTKC